MRVVAIASCKGVAGKTTLAGHLAVAAASADTPSDGKEKRGTWAA